MLTTIDAVGRVTIPRDLRSRLGLVPGAKVDISAHGGGAQITPAMEAARLAQAEGRAAIEGDFELDDSVMYALIDAGRR